MNVLQELFSTVRDQLPSQQRHDSPAVDGVYLWGSVGTGKSMLMDLLVGSCGESPVVMRKHFHELMLDVHRQLHELHAELSLIHI